MQKPVFLSILLFFILACTAQAETVYFLVGEVSPSHGDSYVLPLSNTEDIAHARDLIGYGLAAGETIVVATIDRSNPDGLNRNYVRETLPVWSWRVEFIDFADATAEILDGWPTGVEEAPGVWPSGSTIGFWNYTVVAELGTETDLEVWNCDLSADGSINFVDFSFFAGQWLEDVHWGPDVDGSGSVDWPDLAIIANHWMSCFGIPSWASYPNPADTATGAGLHTVLSWAAAPDAVSHDVYFGTDEAAVIGADTTDANVYMGNYVLAQWDTNIYDSNGLQYDTSYYWRVDEKTPCGIVGGNTWSFTTQKEPDIASVAWWRFDEGNGVTVSDSAGGNNGTLRGDTTWVSGKVGPYALQFDGNGDWVEIPDDDSLDIVGQMTICAWIRCNDTGWGTIVAKQPGCPYDFFPGNYRFYIKLGKLAFAHETDLCNDYIVYDLSSTVTEGVWKHVAVTIVQSGDVNFYIDGSGAGSESQRGTFGVVNDEPVRIGIRKDGLWDFLGAIDDVRIYNRALTEAEVQQLYLERLGNRAYNPDPVNNGKSVDPNVVLSWTPNTFAADVNGHDVYFGTDFNDVNDANTTAPLGVYQGRFDVNSWDPCGLELVTTYYWRIDEVNEPNIYKGETWSFTTWIEFDPNLNLVAHWKLDDDANDSSGNNDGTIYGDPCFVAGQIDGALDFNGVNDYVNTNSADLDLAGTDTITVSAWICPRTTLGDAAHIISDYDKNNTLGWLAGFNTSDTFGATNIDFTKSRTRQSSALTLNQWHHVVAVIYPTDYPDIYINGQPDNNSSSGGSPTTQLYMGSGNVMIGRQSNPSERFFNGIIDDVRIYNRALSAGDVQQLYQDGL